MFVFEVPPPFTFKRTADVVQTSTQSHTDASHTVDVFDHVDTEAVSGDGGEHLPRTPPPRQVVGGAPRGDGTEQQLEVVLLGQFFGGGHKCAEFHQDL